MRASTSALISRSEGGVIGGFGERHGSDRESGGGACFAALRRRGELPEQARQPLLLVLAEQRDGPLGLLVDGAGKTAQRIVGLQGELGLVAVGDALLEQEIERELEQRQHVGPVDVADQAIVQPLAGLGVGLVDEARQQSPARE